MSLLRSGFFGLTSSALVPGFRESACFTSRGFRPRLVDGRGARYEDRNSDVVAFDSALEDDQGSHAAIMTTTDQRGAFPPNTLFRLTSVHEPGTWEAPGGCFPMQRLYVVSATYRAPLWVAGDDEGGKMCDSANVLQYGNRIDYARGGLRDIVTSPVLTLEQEFDRDLHWTDWQGVMHSLREEWRYVANGPAQERTDETGRTRDRNNTGKTIDDFKREVNEVILRMREASHEEGMAMRASGFLTTDEVLAVRLYSGPSYQPINQFLRQIAHLTGDFRMAMARHPDLTFTAVVGHLCNAIRKLAAVATPPTQPLYRGVRGELPHAFWIPDAQGLIVATDTAFMSTSRTRSTPISYMAEDAPNVLWELQPLAQTAEGLHQGADISVLSQYGYEEECLFPPYTMLMLDTQAQQSKVNGRQFSPGVAGIENGKILKRKSTFKETVEWGRKNQEKFADVVDEAGKHFLRIPVVATFV